MADFKRKKMENLPVTAETLKKFIFTNKLQISQKLSISL